MCTEQSSRRRHRTQQHQSSCLADVRTPMLLLLQSVRAVGLWLRGEAHLVPATVTLIATNADGCKHILLLAPIQASHQAAAGP